MRGAPDIVRDGGVVQIGPVSLCIEPRGGFGLIVLGSADGRQNYLDAIFDDPFLTESFFRLVDEEGVVVARALHIDEAPYKRVRGKRSRGRLSQGEFFHHDGCSTPVRPRIVEIRCPAQDCVRSMGTSVAAFPAVVESMLLTLPKALRREGGLDRIHESVSSGEDPKLDWDALQGILNRLLRQLDAEATRAFFQEVDARAGAFALPWTLEESRFIANENPGRTAQHRRACSTPWVAGIPNGGLVKRWPAGPF